MGTCFSHGTERQERGISGLYGPPYEHHIPTLHREINKDLKRVLGSSVWARAKIGVKILGKADLQTAFDFVELQMLLPRRHCVDTQVLVLTAAQLACCGMLLQQPLLSSQGTGVQNMCLHAGIGSGGNFVAHELTSILRLIVECHPHNLQRNEQHSIVLFEMRPLQMEAHGVALANLARSLQGNNHLEKLNLNLMGITLGSTTPTARKVFAGVMASFAAMLRVNTTLRLLRFEAMMGGGDEVPWSENDAELVCKAQAAHRAAMRLAFLKGQHPRCLSASPLAHSLPLGIVGRILDMAVPMHPLCQVEFEFFRDDSQLDDLLAIPPGIL